MKIYRFLVAISLISICYIFTVNAQSAEGNFLKDKLQRQLDKFPVEKVHLHLDKPYYVIGDDIWFKAYVLDDGNAVPSLISGVLYLAIIDQKNTLVRTLTLPLLNGVSWGGLKLPNTIEEGSYTLFAYTQWMRNSGSEFFFKKELLIKNPQSKNPVAPLVDKKATDVQFFPEGGTLVEDLPCKVAFKAVNKNGVGEKITGAIYDNDNIQVVDFESVYLGMGQFSITPQAGKTYYAKVKFTDDSEKIVNLPTVMPTGYQLAVNTINPENFIAKVFTSATLLGQQELKMLVHQNGKLYLETKVATQKQIVVIPLKTAALPPGINTLTLLDDKNLPIAERIFFINNASRNLNVNLEGLVTSYSPRSKVNLDINVAAGNAPVQGSFSIATTNTVLVGVDSDNETHILTSLLLKSDLAGHIEKPNAYFSENAQQNNERLDYLMLTQGWRKVLWEKINENLPNKPAFGVEVQLEVSGTLLNNGKPLPNTKLSVISTPKVLFSKDTVTDEKGRFTFDKLNFKEGARLVIKSLAPNNSKVKFLMDSSQRYTPPVVYHYNGTETEDAFKLVNDKYKQLNKNEVKVSDDKKADGTLLKTVEIKGTVNKAPNSLNINGPGTADATFDIDDLKNVFSLNQYLEGRVSGIRLVEGRFFLPRSGVGMAEGTFDNMPQPMKIYVDGAMIDEGSTLEDFPVDNIESIEILKSPAKTFVYGTNDGVILITSKTANSKGGINYAMKQTTPGMVTIAPRGFAITRKFYVPKYDATSDKTPDVRSTVFWEPNLITDKDGRAKISYFNTDVPGTYRMVIEGIDAEGNLARKVLTYEVK